MDQSRGIFSAPAEAGATPLELGATGEDDDVTCPLCYENVDKSSQSTSSKCGHVFCGACIDRGLRVDLRTQGYSTIQSCPLCRSGRMKLTHVRPGGVHDMQNTPPPPLKKSCRAASVIGMAETHVPADAAATTSPQPSREASPLGTPPPDTCRSSMFLSPPPLAINHLQDSVVAQHSEHSPRDVSQTSKPHLLFVTGLPGSGKTYCVNEWIRLVEDDQGCSMLAVVQNQLPWLEGCYKGCRVRFVGRWVKHHGRVGRPNHLDDRGMLGNCDAAQGSDRVPPGVGTKSLRLWLAQWAESGVGLVVLDSILSRVLAFENSTVAMAADNAGFSITILDLDTDNDECARRLVSREAGSNVAASDATRISKAVANAARRWSSSVNPWTRLDGRAPVSATHNNVVRYAYRRVSQAEALLALPESIRVVHDAGNAHADGVADLGDVVNTPCASASGGAACTPVGHGCAPEDMVTEDEFEQQLAVVLCCKFCHRPIQDPKTKGERLLQDRPVRCVGCEGLWHWRCYHGELACGPWVVLCDACEYDCVVDESARPRDTIRFGQILAGLGTAAQQLCELQQEGFPLKELESVYAIEIDAHAVSYALELAEHKGYTAMRPAQLFPDLLARDCSMQALPVVDVLAITLLCAKHSPLHNGHRDQLLDVDDPTTRKITLKVCSLLRRKRSAAKYLLVENVLPWLRSQCFAEFEEACKSGGYHCVLRWEAKGALGVPEHRERILMIYAHKSQLHGADSRDGYRVLRKCYTAALAKALEMEVADSSISLADVILCEATDASRVGDLTLESCAVSREEFMASSVLTLCQAAKVAECQRQIVEGGGTLDQWYTGDLRHGGGTGQFPNLHKTPGRTPTITAEHAHHGLYCFHKAVNRFFLVPELMIARGFSPVAILVACEHFHRLKGGWKRLGVLLGGAVTPAAYRVLFGVLMDVVPDVMLAKTLAPPSEFTWAPAHTAEELASYGMVRRYKFKYLVLPGTEQWLARDFLQSNFTCLPTTDWTHVHTKDFKGPYTKVHVPGGTLHVFPKALQSQGINTKDALRQAYSSPAWVKTDMSGKRGSTAHSVGFTAQPGVRNRIWDSERSANGDKVGQCHFRGQEAPAEGDVDTGAVLEDQARRKQQYLSYLHSIQRVCNATDAAVVEHMGSAVLERVQSMKRAGWHGTISRSYPTAFVGINPGVTCHLDGSDIKHACWQLLGENCAMGLPECNRVLHFQDGDAVVFDATAIWHCHMRTPPELGQNVVISMFWSKDMVAPLYDGGQH